MIELNGMAYGVFLDLSKPFDCISFPYLLQKVYSYGSRDNALHWIKSVLTSRNQTVVLKDPNSGTDIFSTKMSVEKISVPKYQLEYLKLAYWILSFYERFGNPSRQLFYNEDFTKRFILSRTT